MKKYDEWEEAVPEAIKGDSLWNMNAYRLALFLADVGWRDATTLMQDRRTRELSEQLYLALGLVGANLAEGYSRGTGRDQTRFYECALGSARESRDWYHKVRHVLNEAVVENRLELLSRVIHQVLTMIPQQRQSTIVEECVPCDTQGSIGLPNGDYFL